MNGKLIKWYGPNISLIAKEQNLHHSAMKSCTHNDYSSRVFTRKR